MRKCLHHADHEGKRQNFSVRGRQAVDKYVVYKWHLRNPEGSQNGPVQTSHKNDWSGFDIHCSEGATDGSKENDTPDSKPWKLRMEEIQELYAIPRRKLVLAFRASYLIEQVVTRHYTAEPWTLCKMPGMSLFMAATYRMYIVIDKHGCSWVRPSGQTQVLPRPLRGKPSWPKFLWHDLAYPGCFVHK